MKLLIEIPQEFEGHYFHDGFDDSLERLKHDAHLIAGNYEKELVDMLIDAFQRAQVYIDLSPQWIPTTERLPKTRESILGKKSSKVIVAFRFDDGTQGTDTAHTLNGNWVFEDRITVVNRTVTHWMPLPSTEGLNET